MKPNNETGKHQPLYSVLVGERPDISLAARTVGCHRRDGFSGRLPVRVNQQRQTKLKPAHQPLYSVLVGSNFAQMYLGNNKIEAIQTAELHQSSGERALVWNLSTGRKVDWTPGALAKAAGGAS